jgi:hypothetical protein
MFPNHSFEAVRFAPNSIRPDLVRFRLDVFDRAGRMSSKEATKLVEEAGGAFRDWNAPREALPGEATRSEGAAAWDSVRSAWTHAKLIKGGIGTLGDRLDRLPPEFVSEMYGDASGQQVFTNLRALADSYQQGLRQIAEQHAQQQIAQQAAVETADVHRRAITRATTRARKITPKETAYLTSSIAPDKVHTMEEIAADAFRAAALGPGSIWGGISMMRLVKGPKGADILRFAAYSPKFTQIAVKAFNHPFSPIGPEAVAALTRVLRAEQFAPSHNVGQPPPGPAAAPPPPPPD